MSLLQTAGPRQPRGRPHKTGQQVATTLPTDTAVPHIDRDSLLQPDHVHDEPHPKHNFGEMQIGLTDNDFQDAQEQEDFNYDDYDDDDEE